MINCDLQPENIDQDEEPVQPFDNEEQYIPSNRDYLQNSQENFFKISQSPNIFKTRRQDSPLQEEQDYFNDEFNDKSKLLEFDQNIPQAMEVRYQTAPDGMTGFSERQRRKRRKKEYETEEQEKQALMRQKETKNILTNVKNLIMSQNNRLSTMFRKEVSLESHLSIDSFRRIMMNPQIRDMTVQYLSSQKYVADVMASRIENKRIMVRYIGNVIKLALNPGVNNLKAIDKFQL